MEGRIDLIILPLLLLCLLEIVEEREMLGSKPDSLALAG